MSYKKIEIPYVCIREFYTYNHLNKVGDIVYLNPTIQKHRNLFKFHVTEIPNEDCIFIANRSIMANGIDYKSGQEIPLDDIGNIDKLLKIGFIKKQLKKQESKEVDVFKETDDEFSKAKSIKFGALAKEYNLSFVDLKTALSSEFEIQIKSHLSNIEPELLPKFREFLDKVAYKTEE